MKIVVAGTRGIPNILGGVETHCQELYPVLAKKGLDITVVRRSCYVSDDNKIAKYNGVKLKDIYAPKIKKWEAVVHTFLAVCYARRVNAAVLHIHAIGPAIMTPFARLLGLKVVVTHHGHDYKRQKWGRIAKWVLRLGEKMGMHYANEVIVISNEIRHDIAKLYDRNNAHLIFNGVRKGLRVESTDFLTEKGLLPQKYILAVGRFVPEKGFDDLINTFAATQKSDLKLVIAGDADHADAYSESLRELAAKHGVVCTGFVKGVALQELFSHALLFVLPSYHEGLPIVLLEAMSYGIPVLASDICPNREVGLPAKLYFKAGSIEELAAKITDFVAKGEKAVDYDLSCFDWEIIAEQTLEVFRKLLPK